MKTQIREDNANRSTSELIRTWIRAGQSLTRCEEKVGEAEMDLRSAEQKLGAQLAPSDMRVEEEIGIWATGEGDIERCFNVRLVESLGDNKVYQVKIRR